MDAKEKEKYLREAISIKLDKKITSQSFETQELIKHFSNFPSRLFKYRTINEDNLDALKNSYIFLSPAYKMDDQFECATNIDVDSLYNKETNTLTEIFINELADIIDDYPSELPKDEVKKTINALIENNQNLNEKQLQIDFQNVLKEYDKTKAKEAIDAFIKLVTCVWKSDKVQEAIKNLFIGAKDARYTQGIGSLAEINDSQVMWEMYANHYRGYCVEYDFRRSKDCLINTFPVIYGDKRKTELVRIIIALSIEALIYNLSKEKIDTFDKTLDYIRLFVTKYEEWSFQREWRILGEPEIKFKVPKPVAIYIGKKCREKDKKVLYSIARKLKIKVFIQKDNYKDLSLQFERLF